MKSLKTKRKRYALEIKYARDNGRVLSRRRKTSRPCSKQFLTIFQWAQQNDVRGYLHGFPLWANRQPLLLSNLAPDSMHEQLYVCSCIAHSVMSFCFGGYTGSHKHNSWGGYSEEEFNHPIVMNSSRPFYVGQLLDIRVITVLKLQAVYEVQKQIGANYHHLLI